MDKKKLTPKQELFCKEYIIDFNAARAARAAGYSEKTAQPMGAENLTKPIIQAKVQNLMKTREKRTEITSDMVVQELAKMAFHDIRKLYDDDGNIKHINDLDDETASVIASFKSRKENQGNSDYDIIDEYKRYDKIKPLELLGKHLGMFTERVEHSGIDGKPIETKWTIEFIKPKNEE